MDKFLDARIEKYRRYLMASGYNRKKVDKVRRSARLLTGRKSSTDQEGEGEDWIRNKSTKIPPD